MLLDTLSQLGSQFIEPGTEILDPGYGFLLSFLEEICFTQLLLKLLL